MSKKAVTMPQAEKVLQKKLGKGEAAKVLDGLFHRPQGNLKLVPDDADGDAIKTMSVQDRFKQFITKQ